MLYRLAKHTLISAIFVAVPTVWAASLSLGGSASVGASAGVSGGTSSGGSSGSGSTAGKIDAGGSAAVQTSGSANGSKDGAWQLASDASLKGKVEAMLHADRDLSGRSIQVKSEHGVVVLAGAVANAAESDRAASLASSVQGVVSVRNELKVSS